MSTPIMALVDSGGGLNLVETGPAGYARSRGRGRGEPGRALAAHPKT
ncbi:MAG: hypothetical protein M3O70_11390 [Actinomycetota bacterium]|nr:hypothetical protein [Actinomycetota bacterium]